jgi:2-succinyl-5-enolpyruvyl-6-hydroxy-3-cyclohexene-1-carboxylate synthase
VSAESAATDFAVHLLREFVSRGVRDIVVSPGSRSQALGLAAAAFDEAGLLRLRVRIDERVAGFLALGLAVESRMPVLVVTTSGTAVANLHPAVLEAYHSGVPLILLTADRPAELRGIGSNQTTVQPGLFAAAVRVVLDVEAPEDPAVSPVLAGDVVRQAFAAAAGIRSAAGPVQVNLAFREPLSAAVDVRAVTAAVTPPSPPPSGSARREGGDDVLELAPEPHTVVVAGHAAGERAEELARALGAPLLAEVSSGARFGPNLVVAYRPLLADPAFGGAVRRAVVFGHPTLSREVPALLGRADVEVVVVRGPSPEDYDPGRNARVVDGVRYDGPPAERSWAGRWVAASRDRVDAEADAAAEASAGASAAASSDADSAASRPAPLGREQLAVYRQPVSRRMLVDAVWRATWPLDRLVFGASRLVREADRQVPGRRISVHSNRGLAGIDGTVSTAIGIALAAEASGSLGTTRVVLGDLTLLHDAGGLALPPGESRPRLQVIVGNDGGGTIFDGLEVAQTAPATAFDRVLYTPQRVDLRALAAAYGWEYRVASNRGALDEALAPVDGPTLVEVPLPRD